MVPVVFFYDNYNTGSVTSRYTADTFKAKPANLETLFIK